MTPASVWTALLVDAALATIPSCVSKPSLETEIFMKEEQS
jgi:hypothetical protein